MKNLRRSLLFLNFERRLTQFARSRHKTHNCASIPAEARPKQLLEHTQPSKETQQDKDVTIINVGGENETWISILVFQQLYYHTTLVLYYYAQ